jgi:hypothetical protein
LIGRQQTGRDVHIIGLLLCVPLLEELILEEEEKNSVFSSLTHRRRVDIRNRISNSQ